MDLTSGPALRDGVGVIDYDAIIEKTAETLGVTAGAIRQWRKRGKVPHHIRFDLAERAKADTGQQLRHSDFEEFGKAREGKAA